MMNTKWLRILLFTIGLVCIDNRVAWVDREDGPEIARALSDMEKLLPDEGTANEIRMNRRLYTAHLIRETESPKIMACSRTKKPMRNGSPKPGPAYWVIRFACGLIRITEGRMSGTNPTITYPLLYLQ